MSSEKGRLIIQNSELTLKDKVYGPVCPKCYNRTGRPKMLISPTFKCSNCGLVICFRKNKFMK